MLGKFQQRIHVEWRSGGSVSGHRMATRSRVSSSFPGTLSQNAKRDLPAAEQVQDFTLHERLSLTRPRLQSPERLSGEAHSRRFGSERMR